jgi:hypothetical protein
MSSAPRARRQEIALVVAWLLAGLAFRVCLHHGGWRFSGSDSIGYLKLANELRDHGRYALGPTEPLGWVRPPLYPIFLAVIGPPPTVNAPWGPLIPVQIALDLGTSLLTFLLARRLAGKTAGFIALTSAVLSPFLAPFTAAMLTETLATFLTTAVLATIVLGAARPLVFWPLGGALVGLSSLLRPDGLILAVAFLPPLLLRPVSPRRKLTLAALTFAAFAVLFAPWPLRNLARFGEARPLGGRVDRLSHPVENYAGYWAWLRSWSRDWIPMTTFTTCYYDVVCQPRLNELRAGGAYDDLDDEVMVRRLVTARFIYGLTPEVDAAFQRLADARRRAHPLLVEVALPSSRAWHMWTAKFNELFQGPLPWAPVMRWVKKSMRAWATLQWLIILVAGAGLTVRRQTRVDAATLFVPILVRTLVLGYTFYCMPRYALEVMPLGWALGAAGLVEGWRSWRATRNPVGSG